MHTEKLGGFTGLGLDERLVATLTELGYEEPTPIQREAIPPLLAGRDVLGHAATGTGKTAAFALPLLQRIAAQEGARGHTSALVLVPTRELAMQVADAVRTYGRALGIRVLPVYGGQAIGAQLRALRNGAEVVIATPGRALDHIRRDTLALDQVRTVVLDEADEMLDMGFAEELEAILEAVPATRQTALFSATVPPRIRGIAARHLTDPVHVAIARDGAVAGAVPLVRQTAHIVARTHKVDALARVLDVEHPTSALVFCRTRTEVDELTDALTGRGYRAEGLHGGLSQEQRDRVMKKMRAGAIDLLIATDVAARGLDIEHLSHVVNYDVPSAPEAYVHRIGRTGRAGREGVAITLAEPREHRLLRNIERVTKQTIEIATLPSVADLRARRLERTAAAVRDALASGELDAYRAVIHALAGERDVADIAAAALKLAANARRTRDEVEIPSPALRPNAERRSEAGTHQPRERRERVDGRWRAGPPRERGRAQRHPEWEVTRLFVGAGRKAGIRPGDLVGAIANEVGIDSSAIGAIEIADRFSLVEVPDEIIEDVITALRGTTIKGKRVTVRRDLGPTR
ncbi:MAG: DEAD/DEAH box helicase [Gemmatimonadaceae bacterium]|nr:DEAD/DEAH box helicase [Gemmatimonadaceae bacterium]